MEFSKLLQIEEFVKAPVATHTVERLTRVLDDLQSLQTNLMANAETSAELRKLLSKYTKTPFTGQAKLPPGSGAVRLSLQDSRYFLCRLSTLRAQIHLLYGETQAAIDTLRIAAMWCVRSAECCELLGGTLRLSATNVEHIEEAEKWLLRSIEAGQHLEGALQAATATASHSTNPMSMYDEKRIAAEQRAAESAGHRLLLLLCQTQRCEKADEILRSLGYKLRLAEELLNYPLGISRAQKLGQQLLMASDTVREVPAMAVCDDVLPPHLLQRFQTVFAPESSFWRQHHYDPLQSLSRSVGFFSYVYPFTERRAVSVQEQVVDLLLTIAPDLGVDLSQAQVAEWWVHSRVHAAGHQLHYDSDEKHMARGGAPRHPLFSCVIYLCDSDTGGPTVLTDQRLNSTQRGIQAWLCMPKMNRLLFFDATYLHGVLPGVGAQGQRRLSFMVGFWSSLSSVLEGEKPGAAHCYPPVPAAAPLTAASPSPFSTSTAASLPASSNEVQEEPWYLSHGTIEPPADTTTPEKIPRVNVAREVVDAIPALWTPLSAVKDLSPSPQTQNGANYATSEAKREYDLLFQGF